MTTPNNFGEYYKTISSADLLDILDNQGDYQPLALDAARAEWARRNLSEEELQSARQVLENKKAQKEIEKEKIKAVETKIKAAGNSIIDTINPIQTGVSSAEKTIRLIVIVFGGIFLYDLLKEYRMHLAYLKDFSRFPLEGSLYFFPLLLLFVSILLFWARKKLGWILLAIFITFSTVSAIMGLIHTLTWKPSGLAGFDKIFIRPSPGTYIFQLIFLAGILYVLCKTNIREVFSVNKQTIGLTIGISGFLSFILLLLIS